ncbi:DUF72 domain-containing protein [Caldisericum exile]|uniref:DUF72 domain-containing protein n=1 Tax=Caldisericum exile (strain DSM 21853 / NBRC 104410 / AZM16c01) TaxID=511051 RepID=A0A7U6GFL6_CALEA|nr:DUF72 domain-containing protein [Caldisericum exile]BAL81512.1 hypothetical protein CSE_13860 [Caldisericum exile AZM16c01]
MKNSVEWYIGTSGFQFDDWIGTFYPPGISKSKLFDYYIKNYGFNTVELNSTFYAIPGIKSVERLVNKAPHYFKFAVKVHASITHEQTLNDLWKFLEVSKVFINEGKLLAFLAQFPYSFKNTEENILYLYKLHDAFTYSNFLFIEVRHDSWNSFARTNNDFNFVVPDLPNLPHLPKFSDWIEILKGRKQEMLYARFHGRNKNWYEADEKTRYDYFYSDEELKAFKDAMESIPYSIKAGFFNNCFLGKAGKNAFRFKEMVD